MTFPSFPLPKSEIQFGIVHDIEDASEFGINKAKLELDKEYDLKEMGEKAGIVICYIENKDISVENVS